MTQGPRGRRVGDMNLLRRALLFWVCVLALLGVATAGAQTPLEASFEFTPAEPAVNELVTLADTTKNDGRQARVRVGPRCRRPVRRRDLDGGDDRLHHAR